MIRLTMIFACVIAATASVAADLPDRIEFNRDVRPILSENCFFCHGPDKNKRQADLRLDTSDGLFGADNKPGPVKSQSPDQSELFSRITTVDPELRMPPVGSGKELSPRDIAVLKKWIQQGAGYEGHWAFQPIRSTSPPQVAAADFVRNEIDQFILQSLQDNGLEPSPAADLITLIRRLHFDLLGLPPTPEAVDKFVHDARPEAYELLVDQLLESPHFGERMAVWWLDLVRYADTVGYHGDQNMNISPFRDYVIRSFNANKPFDVFTREQLAGDLQTEPTLEQQIASGYNRLGMMSAEGGVQDKEYLAKYIAERVRNVSGTWLGATMGCAECHDHKYDPFTMQDFYSMEAFFADIEERGLYSGAHETGLWGSSIAVPSSEQAQRQEKLDAEIAALKQTLGTPTPELATAQLAWEKSVVHWTVLKPETMVSQGNAALNVLEDGSILVSGENPATEAYTITAAFPKATITALRLEVLPDDSLPAKGPGRAANGNFVLTEVIVEHQLHKQAEKQRAAFQNAAASFEQTTGAEQHPSQKWAIESVIDHDEKGPQWGWAILDQAGKPNQAVLGLTQPISGDEKAALTVQLLHNSAFAAHALGRFRLSVTDHPMPVSMHHIPEKIAAIVSTTERTESQQDQLAAYFRSIAPALEEQRTKLREVEQVKASLQKQIPTTLVTKSVMPRPVRVLKRGNWMDDSGDVVTPAFPGFLPQPVNSPDKRLTRRDLAEWIMSPDNPLTARAFANRQWKIFFGAGLSRKLDDLGGQGEWPSHPQLLDWLAMHFRDSGWNVKQFVKLLVMSGTYRQSSRDTPQLRETDPLNRLLARQSRFRIEAEFVRDNALSVSGLLVTHIGGKSVRPYQPPGYWAYLNFPMREWQNGHGDELYRRGLYTHWQRQYLHPSLLAFDAPSREECTADRPRSNTPLQSLALLNDPTYVEAARSLAEQTLKSGGGSTTERLNWLFHRVLSRAARPAEMDVLTALLQKHQLEYQAEAAAAATLITVGAKPVMNDIPPTELAAWTSVTRTLLNLHETMTRN